MKKRETPHFGDECVVARVRLMTLTLKWWFSLSQVLSRERERDYTKSKESVSTAHNTYSCIACVNMVLVYACAPF